MQARPRNVEVYESASGAAPFDDWMRDLKDSTGKASIVAGRKNTQKQDIRAAKRYWADYKVRE